MGKRQRTYLCILCGLLICGVGGIIVASNVFGSEKKGKMPQVGQSVALFENFSYKGNDDFYTLNPLPNESYFYNPILPGWYSDPSICTNDEGDYFLVTSTFVYYPGVPIFHSEDLVSWKQVGNVLSRPSQLVGMEGQGVSRGIFAPSISYNPQNKTYYMVTTNVGCGNFFVKAQDPYGEWSDPILLPEVHGIDPSFFFDTDGRAYIVNNDDAPNNSPEYDGHRTIRIREFDVERDKVKGNEKVLVNKGAVPEDNPIWIEGPHMYRVRGSYILMSAEGGTGGWHSEVVFKSDSPWGPFVAWQGNPILTQRGLSERSNPVTCAGHADLVETKEGDWWAVFLGCRPLNNNFENLGRETFLMPVKWTDDGWPYMTQGNDLVPLMLKRDGVTRGDSVTFGNFEKQYSFDEDELGLDWLTLRASATDLYSLTENPGYLTLRCADKSTMETSTPAFVARRLQHHNFECETTMLFDPCDESEAAGLLLFKDETHQYFMGEHRKDGKKYVTLWQTGDSGQTVLAENTIGGDTQKIYLKIASTGTEYSFYYATERGKWHTLKQNVDARYLSTAFAGGFTGTVVGMYATRKLEISN